MGLKLFDGVLGFFEKPCKNIPLLEERISSRLTDDRRWWTLWMDSYTLPCILAAQEAGVLDSLAKDAKSLEHLRLERDLSVRSAWVFLNHLEILGLVKREGQKYSLTALGNALTHRRGSPEWMRWFREYAEIPVNPTLFIHGITKNRPTLLLKKMPQGQSTLNKKLSRICRSVFVFPAILAAHQLGLLPLLASGKASEDSLMEFLAREHKNASRVGLRILLARLEDRGIIKRSSKRITLTSWARTFLDPESPHFKGGTLDLMKEGFASPSQSIEALRKEQGKSITLMDQATVDCVDRARVFARHMDAQGAGADVEVAHSGVFTSGDRIVDIAGGAGSYSIVGATLHDAQFLIFEKGAMTQVAGEWISANSKSFKGRVRVYSGDMFQKKSWEKMAKAFRPNKAFASNVFHDWTLEKNAVILQNTFDSLVPGGQIILHEMLLAPTQGPYLATAFSETLRVWTEGRQYRLSEITAVLRKAGFKNVRTRAGLGPFSIIIADKP